MYLFELVADDLCGTVTSLRRRRRWRALPCWDPCGGLAWAPGLLVFLVRAHRARAVAQTPTPVPGSGPGV